jgi:hypothetical protein
MTFTLDDLTPFCVLVGIISGLSTMLAFLVGIHHGFDRGRIAMMDQAVRSNAAFQERMFRHFGFEKTADGTWIKRESGAQLQPDWSPSIDGPETPRPSVTSITRLRKI